jgi:hypothetical protein
MGTQRSIPFLADKAPTGKPSVLVLPSNQQDGNRPRFCRDAMTNTHDHRPLTAIERLRFDRSAAKLDRLGARCTAEFLAEVGQQHGIAMDVLTRAENWTSKLSPEMLRTAGADRFPPRPLRCVP